ncbi:GRAM domain-containing protein [Clostridium grantii]|uniref:GRAM domain-containing protein n=1 Tax=Clostridium grantii DSM 8605 TaxID=1121316 RepID=A0A1M5WWL9_9CLOT|nr:GRAM domain-containing protein [Clostridium grantii]SHH91860.1 hypothetical protein SAMN02745207_03167 [Clostridium grantii DSM 8605]
MINIIPKLVTKCEDEKLVRQYNCTSLHSKLLGVKTEGNLAVTNKRVIFNATGKSRAGKSIIQSEVPIEDISGIGFYKGTYFSLMHLLFVAVSTLFFISFFTSSAVALLIYDYEVSTILLWITGIGLLGASFFIRAEKVWRCICLGISASSFTILGGVSSLSSIIFGGYSSSYGNNSSSERGVILLIAVVLGIYYLVSILSYSKRQTMSMSINSKSGGGSPIHISGIRSLGFSNQAASKALEADPGRDAEKLIKELGAVIMDIQKLGELACEKWCKSDMSTDNEEPSELNTCAKCNTNNSHSSKYCIKCGNKLH